jgi:2-polyprenyl-3-methyl-5-hydroxy-6-metoxy-1,4-benzoquinol methylase
MTNKELLINLYSQNSKHSNYQILSKRLESLINFSELTIHTRFESERLEYLLKKINFANKSVLDIGGNSGYFTFEILDRGASHVHYYEGNNSHYQFVKIASEVLEYNKKITCTNDFFSFKRYKQNTKYDIILLLNVMHHFGEDYGNQKVLLKNVKNEIIKQLNNIADIAKFLVFQIGFNWKGNKNFGLFENGTKLEMINFIKEGTYNYWEITDIGIAQKINDKVIYEDINEINICRDDRLGEFLNRPLFILKSKSIIK